MMKKEQQTKTVRVQATEAKAKLDAAIDNGDRERRQGLLALTRVSRVKLIGLRRERARAEVKYGAKSERANVLDQKLHVNHSRLVDLRAENDRSNVKPVERQEDAFIVFGYVRDADGHAVAKADVRLKATDGDGKKPVAMTHTTECGYYELLTKAGAKRATPLQLVAGNEAQGCAARLVYPKEGATSYQDLRLPIVTNTGNTSNLPTRYLGNAKSAELHDLDNEQPGCQIAEIHPGRRIFFESFGQATAVGYDFCAHCFGKDVSKR